MLLTTLTLFLFTACGDKEEDTSSTEDTSTEETDTEETDTEETDTEDTDTEDTETTEASAEAEAFCDLWTETCGDWTGDTSCTEFYDAAPAGTEGDNSGATQACYEFHLDNAISTGDDIHCGHASGEPPCVD